MLKDKEGTERERKPKQTNTTNRNKLYLCKHK